MVFSYRVGRTDVRHRAKVLQSHIDFKRIQQVHRNWFEGRFVCFKKCVILLLNLLVWVTLIVVLHKEYPVLELPPKSNCLNRRSSALSWNKRLISWKMNKQCHLIPYFKHYTAHPSKTTAFTAFISLTSSSTSFLVSCASINPLTH